MPALSILEVDAEWRKEFPDVEEPSFRRDVWPGMESGLFGIDTVVIRHCDKYSKRSWRNHEPSVDTRRDWSTLKWDRDLDRRVRSEIKEVTSCHLEAFFRMPLASASRILQLWAHWPKQVSSDFSMLQLEEDEMKVIHALVAFETKGSVLISWASERCAVVFFAESSLIDLLAANRVDDASRAPR